MTVPVAPLFAQDQYLSEVRHTTPLTPETESLFLAVCHFDADAKEQLVAAYQPLVLNIARRYFRRDSAMELMDLVQEGNLGLLSAFDQYNPTRGTAFSTLAFICIRAAITSALWQGEGLIRLPDEQARDLRRLDQVEAALCASLGRSPSFPELAAGMVLPITKVRELLVLRARQIASLDTPLGDGTNNTVADVVVDTQYRSQGQAERLADALASLSEQEQLLIRERFGLDGASVTPRRVVAERMGLLPREIERLEQAVQRKIAHFLSHAA